MGDVESHDEGPEGVVNRSIAWVEVESGLKEAGRAEVVDNRRGERTWESG